jgi:hypothetical protein
MSDDIFAYLDARAKRTIRSDARAGQVQEAAA